MSSNETAERVERKTDEEETKAEQELQAALKAATEASEDEKISGLGPSTAPLYFKVRPSGPPASQYTPLPASGEKPLVLTYFAIRGLGETQRMMLAEAGVAYDHIVVIGGEHQDLVGRWRERSPNGLLPLLSGLGIPRNAPICQSGTIIRFLARRLGFLGSSQADALNADMLFETAKDLGAKKDVVLAQMPGAEKDMSSKGPFALALRLETMLQVAPSPSDHDSALTFGQLQLLNVLTGMEESKSGSVAFLSPSLDSFRVAASTRPRLQAYLSSGLRFPATSPGSYSYATGPLRRGDVTRGYT